MAGVLPGLQGYIGRLSSVKAGRFLLPKCAGQYIFICSHSQQEVRAVKIPRLLFLLSGSALALSAFSLISLRADDTPPVEGDKLEVVFLGEGRPLFMRFQVSLHGKPARQVWQQRIAELFQFLDRDKD